MMKAEIKKIIETIKDSDNFYWAFVHSSYRNEKGLENCYETLEFLGDSILNFHASLFIYCSFPLLAEGQMSKLKQLMVKEETLAQISKEIGLADYLQLGSGEMKNGGMDKPSILADVFESFVAALYLEKGEKAVWNFLNLTLFSWVKGKEDLIWDYKSQLQELCQAQHDQVFYRLSGKPKRKGTQTFFVVEVSDRHGKFREEGEGRTKKAAEQEAAKKVLKKLKEE